MYGMLIEEVARARHEERLCGIPGPVFRRKRRPRPEQVQDPVTSPPRRRSVPSSGRHTPVRI